MHIEIYAVTVTTHSNPRTGDQVEDQRHATTYRVDLAQLAGLLRPLAEMILTPAEKTNGRNGNGNGVYHVPSHR